MKRIILFVLCIIVVLSCSKENGLVSTNVQYSRGKTEYFFDGEKIYETTSSYSSDDDIDIEVIGTGFDISLAGYFAEMIFPYDVISFNEDGYLYMDDTRWYEYTSSHIVYSDNEIKGLTGKNINYSVNGNAVTFEINYQDAGCRVTKVVKMQTELLQAMMGKLIHSLKKSLLKSINLLSRKESLR